MLEDFSNKYFGQDRNVVAAQNPAFLADTVVWNKEFYIKYNLHGNIEERGCHRLMGGFRIYPRPENVRPASEIEILAFRKDIEETYCIDPLECEEKDLIEMYERNIKYCPENNIK